MAVQICQQHPAFNPMAKTKPKGRTRETKPAAAAPEAPVFQRVGRRELAALMGVSPDTITDYIERGMPVLDRGGRGREARFDLKPCLGWQREQLARPTTTTGQTVNRQQLADL